jgi:uncharacterized protein
MNCGIISFIANFKIQKMYKSSFYNLLIPVPETKETLLYNTFHGGVIVLNSHERKKVANIVQLKEFLLDENSSNDHFLKMLIEKKYIIDSTIDEFNMFKNKNANSIKNHYYNGVSSLGFIIGTTSNCNMACPYCFEFKKPNYMIDDDLIEFLDKYIKSIITQSPDVKKWKELGVTWYGGEPLIGIKTIEKLTPKLISLAQKYRMEYYASIITNGILLTRKAWDILMKCHVTRIQVTVDGIKEIHNAHRPLKKRQGKNYEQILENIALMPEGMQLTIRINTDTNVVEHFEEFLDDLDSYKIWPQRHKNIRLYPSRLRSYPGAKESDLSGRISIPEWDSTRQKLIDMMLDHINKWAKINNTKKAKTIFMFPQPRFEDCRCLVSPHVLTIGADGYIYKCWEHIHDEKKRIQHIKENYDRNKFSEYLNFNRIDRCHKSSICKFLPICNTMGCIIPDSTSCHVDDHRYLEALKNRYLRLYHNIACIKSNLYNVHI